MGNNNMASRTMLSKILKNTLQSSLRGQQHPIKKVLSKNAPCIANVVYRKLSSSVIRKGDAGGPIEQRTPQEMKDQWVGFGYSTHDKFRDTVAGHICMFIAAGTMFIPVWLYNYMPDYSLMNWTQREAYLLLKEREDAGIFPISKDFIDPEKVILPSDEELGDIDILI